MVNYIFKDKYEDEVEIGKIVCLAQTYKKHAEEMNSNITKEPLLFLKPSSSVIFNENSIIIPSKSKCIHHEVELGVVIGKKCKDINQKYAENYIRLSTCFRYNCKRYTIRSKKKWMALDNIKRI